MLDPRVAHGAATTSLEELSSIGFLTGDVQSLYQQKIKSGGLGSTVKGARKKLLEFRPLLDQSWLIVHQAETKKFGPYVDGLSLESFKDGETAEDPAGRDGYLALIAYRFTFMIDALRFSQARPIAIFTRHAIARNYQREAQKDKHRLAHDLVSTLPSIFLMNYAIKHNPKIVQVVAKTCGGLYVGHASETPFGLVLAFKTFLNIENLQPKYRAALGSLAALGLDRFADRAFRHLILREEVNVNEEEHGQIMTMFESREMQWMFSPYEKKQSQHQIISPH